MCSCTLFAVQKSYPLPATTQLEGQTATTTVLSTPCTRASTELVLTTLAQASPSGASSASSLVNSESKKLSSSPYLACMAPTLARILALFSAAFLSLIARFFSALPAPPPLDVATLDLDPRLAEGADAPLVCFWTGRVGSGTSGRCNRENRSQYRAKINGEEIVFPTLHCIKPSKKASKNVFSMKTFWVLQVMNFVRRYI